ncbi:MULTISPECIES: DNA topoisomerase IB [Pseudomonas]|uniref:DNA topoisomerase IB n=1 Tax=Pseudomonas nitroreducens TaxID=46680 RepID=UPI001E2A42FB|nr:MULTISPECIES: DNA topoisomerase IB [Pseudomonas]MCE4069306.1 DNA topoisomerase IB [Pseudomonas nitritireducens]MCE4079530.1 DNA topoisomerase IB [Pseudomonas nitroreducens]
MSTPPELPDLPPDLHYVDDRLPGISRRRLRGRFAYFDPGGERIRVEAEIERINRLAIPPAYIDVWICIDPLGHLQATGRDVRGRKQYRYHPRWTEVRDSAKYERLLRFGESLPALRRRIERDLALPGLGAEKVMATVVELLDRTLIRIGNERYRKENRSFGLTTLNNRHVEVRGTRIRFAFRGKSGIRHSVDIEHPRLARILRRCLELPGQQLFQYLDADRQRHMIDSRDINTYLREHAGEEFTAKDYRTWAGTTLALEHCRRTRWEDEKSANRQLKAIIQQVADELGNTPAICRKCYIHPRVIEAFLAGELNGLRKSRKRQNLSAEEATLLAFLSRPPS